jgi:anti-sigma B factor antagonist
MFEIRLGDQGEIVMTGRLDAGHSAKALQFLDALPAPRVVDLAALEYVSSAGLGVLLKTQKRMMASGKGLQLVNVNQHIRDIFKYSGFDRIFEIVDAGLTGT